MLRLKRSRVSVAFVVLFIFLAVVAQCSIDSIPTVSLFLNLAVGIKYGKYCGVGYTGCPGETPCDDLDACCKDHDDCVGEFGMVHVKCHKRLKNCLKRVQKSGKAGFSKECPVSTAAPTMIQGMDLAIMLSQWGSETAI